MPTYQYACTECGHDLEAVQAFTDDSLTECPRCHGRLRKVFGAVGIVFKGSGFYRTDSRDTKAASDSNGKTDKADAAVGAAKTDSNGTSSSDGAASSSKPSKTDGTAAGSPAKAAPTPAAKTSAASSGSSAGSAA